MSRSDKLFRVIVFIIVAVFFAAMVAVIVTAVTETPEQQFNTRMSRIERTEREGLLNAMHQLCTSVLSENGIQSTDLGVAWGVFQGQPYVECFLLSDMGEYLSFSVEVSDSALLHAILYEGDDSEVVERLTNANWNLVGDQITVEG